MKCRAQRALALVAIAVGASLLGVRALSQRVAAQLREQALALAPALGAFAELVGRETRVELNGHRLHLSSLTTDRDVDALLARFAQLCASPLPLAPAALTKAEPTGRGASFGVLRQDLGAHGVMGACLARSDGAGLLDRLATYRTTGDLTALGQPRFVLARRTPEGASHVLFAWSEGPLRLASMFPAQGDSAGRDLARIPRPEGGRRVLSAAVHGSSHGVVAHAVPEAPEAALTSYLSVLAAAGFTPIAASADGQNPALLHALVRGEEQAIVHGFREDGATLIAVTRLATKRLVRAAFEGVDHDVQ